MKVQREWRLLDTGLRSAAENIALDDVLLEQRSAGLAPNTVRFLQFLPEAVLVGYHQAVEHEVRVDFCEGRRIDINRRLTGGGAIFFDSKSLGWEVVASKGEPGVDSPLHGGWRVFEMMCRGAILGLRSLGVEASFRPKNDIEVEGRKISGTGGTERAGALLFQGTLLVDFDVETMLRALRIPLMKLKDKEVASAKERVTWLRRELGRTPDIGEVKAALAAGFEEALGVELAEGGLTPGEEELLRRRLGFFRSPEWIFRERRPLEEAETHAVAKTSGGLVRVSLALDRRAGILKSVLITGDFFVFPSRGVLDLEAGLKGATYHDGEVARIVREFFDEGRIRIPGLGPDHLIDLITEAVGRTRYEELGIGLAEANHVYTVNCGPQGVLDGEYDVLLLPYCAKLPGCEYRRMDGCARCGGCSAGRAYEIAEEARVRPMTILNFEHLMETLAELRRRGAGGYIGCCCEGFYCKHQDDLKASGLPGVLLDIDDETCYDLGREREALAGTFESQTELKLELLEKLLRVRQRRSTGDA